MPKLAKRLLVGVGILFGLLVIAAIAVPLFVDVDKYRPQIVEAANQNLTGKLELGKLKLTLWGRILVQVDGFTLNDVQGRKVVGAKDVYFHVPLWPLLTGSPVVTFRLKAPEVNVVKDKKGKLNVTQLVKTSPKATSSAPAETAAAPAKLPGIAARARLGIEMRDAHLAYSDEASALVSKVDDLNLLVENISASHPMDARLWANLDTKMGKTLTVKGPAELKAHVEPKFVDGSFAEAAVTLSGSMDKVEILMPDLFHKKSGVAANLTGSVKVTTKIATIESIVVKFHNAEVTTTGSITELDTAPVLAVKVASNSIALGPWAELVPMLKSYELGGAAGFSAALSGPTADPGYKANLELKAVTAKAPTLKAQPVLNANVDVAKDKVERILFTMKAPGNDLKITGTVVNFAKPKVDVLAVSTGLDIDQLVDMPKTPAKTAGGEKSSGSGGKAEDYDAMVDPLRKNEMAAAAVANIRFQIASLKAKGVKLSDMGGSMSWRDLAFALDNFHFGIFGGSLKTSAGVQLKPKQPTYRMNMQVANLDMQQAVSSQLELFKNTLLGRLTFNLDARGASFNPEPAKANLDGKGNLRVDNAIFQSIDIGKMTSEAISKGLAEASSKVPQLRGLKVPVLSASGKFESVTSDFTIAGGKFSAPNFFAKAEKDKGIDIKGATSVGLKDYALAADWEIIDTYNQTKARDLSVDVAGMKVDHVLAAGNDPVKLPVRVSGSCFSPQFNYGAVPESLAKIALNNTAKAAETKVKAEVRNKVETEAKKAIQNFGKGLFR